MYKHFYQRFIRANPDLLHMAAHSHHFWPDVTREAMLEYWDDSAQWVDDKWGHFFSEVIPKIQKKIGNELGFSKYEHITFAPNTHELLYRLLSCFPSDQKIKILTTDSEFYSFSRQAKRLEEDNLVELTQIKTIPFESFEKRFIQKINDHPFDMVFISHVFFNSGLAIHSLNEMIKKIPEQTMVVVDGYHGFMALPHDFSELQDRIFYLSGAYKYAQGGEGACFLYSPKPENYRPRYTGWFAEIGDLGKARSQKVPYSSGALRFAGSTIDLTPLYRLKSVFDLFDKEQITTSQIHNYILSLQDQFLEKLSQKKELLGLKTEQVLNKDSEDRGHFLTFELEDTETTLKTVKELSRRGIKVDSRENRLRFGFGMYIDSADVDLLIKRMES
jgi:selenocysteine lyase/cysteine desulfurase